MARWRSPAPVVERERYCDGLRYRASRTPRPLPPPRAAAGARRSRAGEQEVGRIEHGPEAEARRRPPGPRPRAMQHRGGFVGVNRVNRIRNQRQRRLERRLDELAAHVPKPGAPEQAREPPAWDAVRSPASPD